MALVLPSLYPVRGSEVKHAQAAMLSSCLPPEDYRPSVEAIQGKRDPVTLTETIQGFAFHVAALDFVRLAHPMVRWAPGGADVEGFHTITEIDLLHGFVNGRCVACVCRMAPRSEDA